MENSGIRDGLKPVLPAVHKRWKKDEVLEIISKNHGIVTAICNELDCTYTQFYYAVKKWNIQEELDKAKRTLVSIAEQKVLECLNSETDSIKLQAAIHCLKTLGAKYGWSAEPTVQIQQQINVTDKETAIKQIFGIE